MCELDVFLSSYFNSYFSLKNNQYYPFLINYFIFIICLRESQFNLLLINLESFENQSLILIVITTSCIKKESYYHILCYLQ